MNIFDIAPKYFQTSEELIKAIASIQIDGTYMPVCRGQGSSDWNLEPGILRANSKLAAYRGKENYHLEYNLVQFELLLINNFLERADKVGFHIPDDSLELRKDLFKFTSLFCYQGLDKLTSFDIDNFNEFPAWPWPNVLNIMSLMQHSGLPTRYLDWTNTPLNAAYFAAKQEMKRGR